MDEDSVKIVLRAFIPESDSACIFTTWRNSAYYGSGGHGESANRFFKKHTAVMKDILRVASVRIACLEDHPDTIIGYSVYTGNHLDWIYVKVDFRCKGIGSLLMPKNIESVTDPVTKIGHAIFEKKKLKTKGEINGSSRSQRDKEKGVNQNG